MGFARMAGAGRRLLEKDAKHGETIDLGKSYLMQLQNLPVRTPALFRAKASGAEPSL